MMYTFFSNIDGYQHLSPPFLSSSRTDYTCLYVSVYLFVCMYSYHRDLLFFVGLFLVVQKVEAYASSYRHV